MALIGDKYQFWVCDTFDENTPTPLFQVYPVNDRLTFSWARFEDNIFYRQTLQEVLIFRNGDFDYFYNLEKSGNCDSSLIQIKKKCGDTWANYMLLKTDMSDGKWDISHCTVDLKQKTVDKYSCFLRDYTKQINLFASGWWDKVKMRTTKGEYQMKVILRQSRNTNEPFPYNASPGLAWIEYLELKTQSTSDTGIYQYATVFIREELVTAVSPGAEWVVDGDKYVRSPQILTIENGNKAIGSGLDLWYNWGEIRQWKKANMAFNSFYADNGVKFEDAINALIRCNNMNGFKSNFFKLNPYGGSPTNAPYDYADDHFTNLAIYQKSDIARPYTKRNASVLKFSLEQLLNDLKTSMEVYWDIDDNGYLIIEHVSHWSQVRRMFSFENTTFIKGKFIYEYIKAEIPHTELKMYNGEVSKWFECPLLTYNTNCAGSGELIDACDIMNNDVIQVNLSGKNRLFTNYFWKYLPPESQIIQPTFGSDIIDNVYYFDIRMPYLLEEPELESTDFYDGICLVSYDTIEGDKYMVEMDNIPDYFNDNNFPQDVPNGVMSLSAMLQPLLTYNRWFPQAGIGNGNYIIMDLFTIRQKKKQEELQIPFCCEDWKANDIIKTALGYGYLDKGTILEPAGILALNLLYK